MKEKASGLIKNVKIGWATLISLKVQHFTATETDQRKQTKKTVFIYYGAFSDS